MAIPDGDDRVVTTYRSGVKWWRNFQSAHDATLWVTGEPVPVTGEATLDERAVASWLGTLQERDQGRVLQFFGLPADADDAALESAAGEVVVVRFTPRAAGAGPTDSSPSGG